MLYNFNEDDAFRFARSVNAKTRIKGRNLHFAYCPYCKSTKDKETFAIELDTGQYHCLRSSCGAKGNFITLARDFNFSLGRDFDNYYSNKNTFKKFKIKKIETKDHAVELMAKRGIGEEVTRKYEITVADKFGEDVIVFPFYDANGNLRYIKYRDMNYSQGKTFINKKGETVQANKEWCEENCMPILFGMKQCNDKFDRLIITEGQLDSLSVAEAGIENAVSVPTGALGFTWVPYCWDWFSKFKELVVFGDYEKGKITLLDELTKRFPGLVKHVRPQDYKDCKDANEILLKYGKGQILTCIDNAEPEPVKRVMELADVEDVDIYKIPKVSSSIVETDRLLYGGLPVGGVAIITGKPGEGKSTLASQILVHAVEGGYKTMAYSGELPNYMFKAWIDFQIAGDMRIIENTNEFGDVHRFISKQNKALITEWYRGKMFIYDNRIIDDDEQEDLCKTISTTIMRYGVKVVLIDNLMTALDLDIDTSSDKYDKQSRFVKKLARIALKYDAIILLVAHKRKNNFSTNTNDEISGSGDITNLATITMSYEKDNTLEESQRRLKVTKNRLFGKVNFDGYVLDYDEKSKRIYGQKDDVRKQFGWEPKDSEGFIEYEQGDIPFN